jgi:hypothetical protein
LSPRSGAPPSAPAKRLVNRRRKAALNGTDRHLPVFPTTLEKGMRMKQLISVLVAAMFAGASMTAVAQEKKPDDKATASQMDKKESTKGAATKSTKKPKKPKSQKGQTKGESTKKPEEKTK